jgi:hypothetical protein
MLGLQSAVLSILNQKNPEANAPGFSCVTQGSLETAGDGNVGGLQALRALFDFELDLLAFF